MRHPAGDSGTGDVPHWSSAGRVEDRLGFPFGGIQETPALARLPGKYPGSLVARPYALPLKFQEEPARKQLVLGLQARLERRRRAPPHPSPPSADGRKELGMSGLDFLWLQSVKAAPALVFCDEE
ncbi:hypothetical protein NDU88_005278 [Pleurodeles waltl]|uniref:Uncharacterized protein n=1 Tax=Pleurodeles waltl TaxID=8319 RepID=A0AAV7M8V4_PLEWA|nr:hypothetical protein NDU88_005278 [Pleurodeles waltl]